MYNAIMVFLDTFVHFENIHIQFFLISLKGMKLCFKSYKVK